MHEQVTSRSWLSNGINSKNGINCNQILFQNNEQDIVAVPLMNLSWLSSRLSSLEKLLLRQTLGRIHKNVEEKVGENGFHSIK